MDKRRWLLALGCFVAITGPSEAAPRDIVPIPPALPSPAGVPTVPEPVPPVEVPVPPIAVPAPPAPSGSTPIAPNPLPEAARAPRVPAQAPGARSVSAVARSPVPGGQPAGSSGSSVTASAADARSERHRPGYIVSRRTMRRIVRSLRDCLPALPPLQARVLVLRAGVGRVKAMSLARVARTLRRPQPRVRRVERRGLTRLKRVRRSGACTSSAGVEPDGTGAADAVVTSPTGAVPGLVVADQAPPRGERRRTDARGGVRGESRRSRTPVAGVIPRPPEPVEVTLPLLIALCSGAWLVGRRLHRRRADAA
jgi:hypothetical protein